MSNIKNGLCTKGLMFLYCLSSAVNCFADEPKDDLDYIYGSPKMLSVAAGHPVPEQISPGVTTVMTSEDIERIGARRIEDILEYIPGVHVSIARAGFSVIGFRGIYSETNAQSLILINGQPLRNVLTGGKPFYWTLPVKNIDHIEVIRGPGSVLYGGDAMTGVINVILKNGESLKGGDVGGFFGSEDTYEGWAQYGNKKGDWDYSVSMQGGTTTGFKGLVRSDAQTIIDQQFFTNVSRAPGFTAFGRDDLDFRLDLGYKDRIRFRAGYQLFNNVQAGAGALALSSGSQNGPNHIFNADLTIKNNLAEKIDNTTTLYYLGQKQNISGELLPPGTFGGALPNGFIQDFGLFQNTLGFKSQFQTQQITDHTLTFETGVAHTFITDASNKTNAIITPNFVQQINLTEVSTLGPDLLLASKRRTNYHALLQDEWNMARDWHLTTGLRYDNYSDVSDNFSPRIGLVYNPTHNLTTKLLYNRAFRPPSFLEKNQPLIPGTAIKNESIDTVEFQVENNWSPALKTGANVYWFNFNNLITSVPTISGNPVGYINNKTIEGIGVEFETIYRFNESFNTQFNYSYHGVSESNSTGYLPEHMFKALADWEFHPGWNFGTQLNWIGERRRPANDPRPNLGNAFIAGFTLRTKVLKPLEFSLRVNNVFNTIVREPSTSVLLTPDDTPTLGRTLLGQFRWSF